MRSDLSVIEISSQWEIGREIIVFPWQPKRVYITCLGAAVWLLLPHARDATKPKPCNKPPLEVMFGGIKAPVLDRPTQTLKGRERRL